MKKSTTVVKFKFKKPCGIALTGYSSFTPKYTKVKDTSPAAAMTVGNLWVDGYDFDEEFTLHLADEKPKTLPSSLDVYDEETKRIFQMEQMKKVQANHEANNVVRDELEYYAEQGIIEVTHDSFHNKSVPKAEESDTVPTFESVDEAQAATEAAAKKSTKK